MTDHPDDRFSDDPDDDFVNELEDSWQHRGDGRPPGPVADLGPRLAAKLVDVVVALVVVAPLWGITVIVMAAFELHGLLSRLATFAVVSLMLVGYFYTMELFRGQTVGKIIFRLEVRGAHGGPPSATEALRRNLYFAAPLLGILPEIGWMLYPLALGGFAVSISLSIAADPRSRQGWHDRFAGGTRVHRRV